MELLAQVDRNRLPRHIAIIMDGNGRWAQERGEDRVYGHYEGVVSVREIVDACGKLGIEYLTLYAFSAENWNRPKAEVDALMELLVSTIHKEVETLNKNKIRLQAIGNLKSLPKNCFNELMDAIQQTTGN